MNCPLMDEEKKPSKNRPNIFSNSILRFSFCKKAFQKRCVTKIIFGKLGLIVKNHLPLQFMEGNWLKSFSMHLCPRIAFLLEYNFLMNYCWD
jgi:hypothetical protein